MVNLQKGLVGHWTFDAGATNNSTAYDSSAYGNHGSFNTSDISLESGKISDSYYFNGNGGVDIGNPDIDLTTTLSICFWFKTEQNYNSRRNPIDKAYGAEFSFTLEDNSNGELNTYFGSAGSNTTPYAQNKWDGIPDNQWNHLVWIRDNESQSVTLYLNGESYSSNRVVTEWETPVSSDDSLVIGDGYTNPMQGNMDDVRIYNRVLSEREVRALYNMRSQRQKTSDLQKGLVGHWTLDAGATSNGTAYDSSANDNHGALNGGVTTGVSGQVGEAYSFDGTDGWIDIGDHTLGSTFSTFSWVNFNNLTPSGGDNHTIAAHIDDGQEGFRIFTDDGDNTVGSWIRTGSNATSLHSSQSIEVGSWHHIGTTFDGTTHKIWYDGKEIASGSPSSPNVSNASGYISRYSGNGYHLDGKQDDVRLYDYALSQSEINRLYNKR